MVMKAQVHQAIQTYKENPCQGRGFVFMGRIGSESP